VVTASAVSSTTDPDMANNSSQVTLTISTSGNVGGGSGGSGCFIATSAYGSYLDSHVQVLRAFRDKRLITNRPGRYFVRMYYRYSPPVAAIVARSAFSRRAARCMLAPLIFAIEYPASLLVLILVSAAVLLLRLVNAP
jgi:hypothetical protein